MNRTGLILILLLAAVTLGVPSVATAGKAHEGLEAAGWVSASPDPAPAGGSRVELTGCGFEFKPAQLRIIHPGGYVETLGVGMWNTGCFSTYFHTGEAGTFTIDVYQAQRNPRKPMVLKASTTLSVQ